MNHKISGMIKSLWLIIHSDLHLTRTDCTVLHESLKVHNEDKSIEGTKDKRGTTV
jgi:hypothetical protein